MPKGHGIYPVELSKWGEYFIQGGKSVLAQRRNSDRRDGGSMT